MDTTIVPLMHDLLTCLDAQLADTVGGAPGALHVAPGATVVADLCSCSTGGQAWVRLARTYPVVAGSFAQDNTIGSCTARLAAVLEVGVLRCVSRSPGNGRPPGPAELANDVEVTVDDARAMRCAVLQCWPGRDRALGVYNPLSSGDCGGGTQLVTVQLGPLAPPDQTRSGRASR